MPHEPISVHAHSQSLANEALSEVLGGLIDTGVVLQADLTLTLAGVDLVYVGLKAVICAADSEPAQAALGRHEMVP
ncbi:MAG: gas vesicle protein [Pseudomonadota bacterium]